ncbi:Hypothetical protein R9X50_00268800 [Acrodontium crateriforme]|uniref:Uncharacterized protein n=1 Tax=Acrodontium crateriforme TaxID=150365 RepID=A0AAQ3M1I9_9PEZI|nr:Hypothetical protein R9X50_00268800 [Acrodontium crateriforme]
MLLPNVSFLLGVLVLTYLCTFIVFAVLRIVTGVSIQRIGYTGLRRIAFSPRPGVRINIRGVGLSAHRPTFALPTWISLVITDLVITLDLNALSEPNVKSNGVIEKPDGVASETHVDHEDEEGHGKLWRKLTEVKEKIKGLHSKIHWIKLIDLVATAATVNVVGVGCVRLERVTLSVDTRRKTVDRSRLFEHHKTTPETQSPAEWKCLIRSVLFTPEGRDSTEILDYCTLNIHGMLHNKLEGLRDASIALKLGRLNLPYDDIEHSKKCADLLRGKYAQPAAENSVADVSLADALEELEQPGSRDERIVRTVSDSRAFISSILRGIQEVQLAVSFFGLSRKLDIKSDSGKNVFFNLAMKEVGLDILRLDSKSPAHRMYFSPKDVAHQALLTAIAISAGIDDGHEHPERMVYVPMVTATVKTTLPSRTIQYSRAINVKERNTNMLYANFVCTSPSVDLDPKHLPLVREMLKRRSKAPKKTSESTRHRLISQLLPKAHVKLSIQEPVIRLSLPPMDKTNTEADDYDLLISSTSSISFELESSHATEGSVHYNLGARYRHTRHDLYYQTSAGDRHDLLLNDTVEVQVDVNGIPDASVTINAQFRTFTIFLVRPEICEGVRQIMKQLRKNVMSRREPHQRPQPSFLRSTPPWLHRCRLEGTDFGLELGGVDEQVSKDTRGFALQLESWTTEYKAQRDERPETPTVRRKSISRSAPHTPRNKEKHLHQEHTSPRKRHYHNYADGRRLTIHLQNLEGIIVDSVDESEVESFMSVPRFEVAFSTSSDSNGPIFHINSHAKSILLQYSLYNHYAMGVAVTVIKKTFLDHSNDQTNPPPLSRTSSLHSPSESFSSADTLDEIARNEITTIDFKTNLIQLKARMPDDPPMMIQIYGLESGRHRWATPFFRCRLTRMYVRAPRTKAAWSRIVSVKVLRLDLRDFKRMTNKQIVTEKSIDIVAETIRFSVPHSLVVHSIFDNITNVVKTTAQLQHHFMTGTNEYILTKEPEGPKHVPRITIRSQLLLFDIEDSSFEWKLGAIYRAGLLEQKQRLARAEVFRLKEKRLSRNARRGSSKLRAQSAHRDDRSRANVNSNGETQRSRSTQPHSRYSPHENSRHHRRKMRYDAEGKCGISDTSQLTIDQAREKLNRLNAQTWKNRIDNVFNFQSHAIREIRTMLWGMDDLPEESENHEPILAMNQRPGLLLLAISDLSLTVDKPSFPVDEFPKFLHDVGKGMPRDMKYGLLVPMSLHVTMSELRFQLRDYPLPLLHVPMLANGQSPRLPSLSMKTDFVIAEEFRDIESQRQVQVQVVPPEKMGTSNSKGFSVDVRRTISPVKTYSDMKFEINTSNPTKITWGTSYQPAIQDTMQVLEGFTKPPVDPSDRVGFWDKIRLSFHSRVNIAWKGDGDVHLILKGSRDPYVVTGHGAGLVMVWRNDVRWNISQSDDPRQFMTVDSGDYILAIPDFNSYARRSQDTEDGDDSSTTSSVNKRDAVFKKVIMKLSGNVRWLAGLMFERDLPDGKRTFEFKDHYNVVLKHPDFAKSTDGEEFDAYKNFRSHHIHMSIAIAAPLDRDWSVSNLKPSDNYNSVHLTPRFFSHFFHWWSMFSGVMSLPVRQGPLWGATEKKSKKFGRHIATIKYNLLLSPLFISHVYKHKDAEEYQSNTVSVTGLKMKLDSFMLDLHQRREHFNIKGSDGALTKTTSGMRINKAQLDFIHADLRALSASIGGTSAEDIDKANDDTLASLHGQLPVVDMSTFEIPDNDFTWIDMDDFVELDWILPAEADPITKILPLGFAPRFTYFRQTDHEGIIAGDTSRTSPFGDEPSHYCVMTAKNDPRRVQAELIERRIAQLREQRLENERVLGEQELKIVREYTQGNETRQKLEENLETMRTHNEHLQRKRDFLQNMLEILHHRMEHDDPSVIPDLETSEKFFEAHENARRPDDDHVYMDSVALADYTSDFNNRFIVHNAQIKWNNSLRNIILRYIHQNSQRRGFVYYMSRRAVKFILDVLEERQKPEASDEIPKKAKAEAAHLDPLSPDADDEATVQERIEQLLQDGRNFINADESGAAHDDDEKPHTTAQNDEIAVEFMPLNTYHFRLIAPQVQLQSEKNQKSAVIVTAKGMQLKVVQIMDKDNVHDDVNGLVQRRFNAAADSLQMFVTSAKTFSTEFSRGYSPNTYGAKAGTHWPPWVPMEMMFEYTTSPYGFSRVVHRTSASLRYDKYNNLRLKYRDDVTGGEPQTAESAAETEDRMDHIWLEFPQFRAICDSAQYYAMYIIVMDLLLYSEPLEKTRSERLEKIMLASDFSDLTGAPEMVSMLQERIRQLEEIKMHFQVNEKFLDRQGWRDRISMDQDLASCEDELFFMMKAITTSQQRLEDRREQDNVTGMMHLSMSAREIAWHLIRDKDESLVEFQLKNASFDRTERSDGSNYNVMEISRINGFNLLPDALYPEIIAPFTDVSRGGREMDMKMLRVQWLMLEAIAGIPVVDYFEVDLVPLRVQVERETAKKLFEYVFPGVGGNAFEGGGFSPFMVKNMLPTQDEEDESAMSPASTPASGSQTPDPLNAHDIGSGVGSLERRLKPTLELPKASRKARPESRGLGISGSGHHGLHGFSLFQHSDKSRSTVGSRTSASRQALGAANSTAVSRSPSEHSLVMMGQGDSKDNDKKRFQLHRVQTDDKRMKKDERSDDLTQMVNRASNYMTLAFVKIPSMVLCLSYKGQGKRNLEDVHDLVFRLPTLEYRNKTWSNLDLALQLKKDVIRALISHAGAIVTNKLSHHRPTRTPQSRLREIANMSTFMSPRNHSSSTPSETSSLMDYSFAEPNPRNSTSSARPSTLNRSLSFGSTPSSSTTDHKQIEERPMNGGNDADGSGYVHAQSPARNSQSAGADSDSSPPYRTGSLAGTQDSTQGRNRTTSISRHLTGFSDRLRQRGASDSASDDPEEIKRKSKLLLGGQKLLRTLRDQ